MTREEFIQAVQRWLSEAGSKLGREEIEFSVDRMPVMSALNDDIAAIVAYFMSGLDIGMCLTPDSAADRLKETYELLWAHSQNADDEDHVGWQVVAQELEAASGRIYARLRSL
jgi:hypothetical protein